MSGSCLALENPGTSVVGLGAGNGRDVSHRVGWVVARPHARSVQVGSVGDRLERCHAAATGVRRRPWRSSWRWACIRWMRLLVWGCWSWSIQRGGIHSGSPSAVIRQVQPFCRKWVWWYLQSSVRFSRSVRPPRIQSNMWCRSHHWGGCVQPGKLHPASRAINAMV